MMSAIDIVASHSILDDERLAICPICDWCRNVSDDHIDCDGVPVLDTDAEFWAYKLWAAQDDGLYAQIADRGVQEPIVLDDGFIRDGYHRIAVMLVIDPTKPIPVVQS